MQFKVRDRVQVRNHAPYEYDRRRGKRGTIIGLNVAKSSFGFRKVGEGFDTPEAAHGAAHLVQFDEGQFTQSIDDHWLSKIE